MKTYCLHSRYRKSYIKLYNIVTRSYLKSNNNEIVSENSRKCPFIGSEECSVVYSKRRYKQNV